MTTTTDWTWLELDPTQPNWAKASGKHRLLLVAINMPGYYSLPVRILALLGHQTEELLDRYDCRYVEIDNTQPLEPLLQCILQWQPELVAFSINIWNRDHCITLARQLRRHNPGITLLGGGQEVTGSVYSFFSVAPEFDYLIEGEGELPFLQFLREWTPGQKLRQPEAVSGLRYRATGEERFTRPAEVVASLDEIPSAILAGLVPTTQRNLLGVMLEGSRGCPFRCSFCFEGAKRDSVRTASIQRLRDEVAFMVARGARYFHIMDAILCNSDPTRLQGLHEVFYQVKQQIPGSVTSVEVYADRVTDEMAQYLSTFSIIDLGLQSTNPATARAIHRPFSQEKYRQGVERLRRTGSTFNIYLICGLPYETFTSFLRGIRFVLDEKPTRLFINELCLLNGTELRRRADEYGYQYDQRPPYLVNGTTWMPPFILTMAQVLAKVLERHYNLSARSIHSTAPWLPKYPRHEAGRKRLSLQEGCSHGCPGCGNNLVEPQQNRNLAAALLQEAADCDVDVLAGDGVARGRSLLQLAGQLQLSATARNRLIAPLDTFDDPAWLDPLVHRGFWHFKTFLTLNSEDLSAERVLLDKISSFDRSIQLAGYAAIRPHLEVVLYPGTASPQAYRAMVAELARRNVTVVTVPEALPTADGAWEQALYESFSDAITQRLWLKLPPHVARRLVDRLNLDNPEEILSLLDGFNLLSHAGAMPPCFSPDTGRPLKNRLPDLGEGLFSDCDVERLK
ncbi:MAG: radical SAM protein [Syntrophotaleaceae bacterium]